MVNKISTLEHRPQNGVLWGEKRANHIVCSTVFTNKRFLRSGLEQGVAIGEPSIRDFPSRSVLPGGYLSSSDASCRQRISQEAPVWTFTSMANDVLLVFFFF